MGRATITFLGGVREIGGNKLLIQDGPDRVLFDFGPSFSKRMQEYYVDYLQPRSASPVQDLLEFNLLPRVEGLYAREALADSDLAYRAPEVHGLFISHAHADHAGYLRLVDPEIPVHVGAGTRRLLEAIETSSPSMKYGDHAWSVFADRTPVKVGGIEVVPYPVDHSIPFAYGFLVRTSEGTVVYTGDFREHGPRAADTHAFLEAARHDEPAALVIEGTRAGPDPRRDLSEDGVRTGVDRILERSDHLALACTYPRDVDRLRTLYEAARAVDREMVVSPRTAHLLEQIAPLFPSGSIPTVGASPGLAVYARKRRRTYRWEDPYLAGAIGPGGLRGQGSRYLLALDLMHFPELIDLRPPRGSPFIHSMSEPFSEDDVDDAVLHNWLEHFGLAFHQMHASGHASGPQLLEIVRSLSPQRVYPVHTEHPDAFEPAGAGVRLPELATPYRIGARGPND